MTARANEVSLMGAIPVESSKEEWASAAWSMGRTAWQVAGEKEALLARHCKQGLWIGPGDGEQRTRPRRMAVEAACFRGLTFDMGGPSRLSRIDATTLR